MKINVFATIVLSLIMLVTEAFAVTYRNDGSGSVIMRDKYENQVVLYPGQTIETYYYNTSPGLTKTSDAPYYNRVMASTAVTLSVTPTEVAVNLQTNWILVLKITGTVNAYAQSTSNTPAELANWTEDDPIIQIPANGKFDKLALTGSGTCVVMQYKNSNL